MKVEITGTDWTIGGTCVRPGCRLTVRHRGEMRSGTVQNDGTFKWDEEPKR